MEKLGPEVSVVERDDSHRSEQVRPPMDVEKRKDVAAGNHERPGGSGSRYHEPEGLDEEIAQLRELIANDPATPARWRGYAQRAADEIALASAEPQSRAATPWTPEIVESGQVGVDWTLTVTDTTSGAVIVAFFDDGSFRDFTADRVSRWEYQLVGSPESIARLIVRRFMRRR